MLSPSALYALGARAVSAGWTFPPGSAWITGPEGCRFFRRARVLAEGERLLVRDEEADDEVPPEVFRGLDTVNPKDAHPDTRAGIVPDLADPATLGCLLALLRAACQDPTADVRYYTAQKSWGFHARFPYGVSASGASEAEALVGALEAANLPSRARLRWQTPQPIGWGVIAARGEPGALAILAVSLCGGPWISPREAETAYLVAHTRSAWNTPPNDLPPFDGAAFYLPAEVHYPPRYVPEEESAQVGTAQAASGITGGGGSAQTSGGGSVSAHGGVGSPHPSGGVGSGCAACPAHPPEAAASVPPDAPPPAAPPDASPVQGSDHG